MKKIIYCLTKRGLFSELSNLALAKLYSDNYGYKLIVNTRIWNVRIRDGMADYFRCKISETHSIFSAQDKIYTKEAPWIGKIYYNPIEFCSYYGMRLLNAIYMLLCPFSRLSKDIFSEMRSITFINQFESKTFRNEFSQAFKSIYIYNDESEAYIAKRRKDLGINGDYISVHVRRGDKITSGEMSDINLDVYLNKICQKLYVSHSLYVATDDYRVVSYFEEKLKDHNVKVFFNENNKQMGFDERNFNNMSKSDIKKNVLNMLFDMDMLIHSNYFIGTYSSNIGRLVPLFIGFGNCYSVDVPWNILYGCHV